MKKLKNFREFQKFCHFKISHNKNIPQTFLEITLWKHWDFLKSILTEDQVRKSQEEFKLVKKI